jgi:hypothetical protein
MHFLSLQRMEVSVHSDVSATIPAGKKPKMPVG